MMDSHEHAREIAKHQNDLEVQDRRQRRGAEQAAASRIHAHSEGRENRIEQQAVRRPRAEEAARLRLRGGSLLETARQRVEFGTWKGDTPRDSEVKTSEQGEEYRMSSAAKALRKNEWLRPERWSKLNPYERQAALHSVGNTLRDAYGCPEPPLLPKDFPEYSGGKLLGYYSDGATKDSPKGDYELALNKSLMASDDPRDALKTYFHEFRHAYQHEMATGFEKPQFQGMVHDSERASEWSRNFRDYKKGPPETMPAEHPDFQRLFDEYQNQPVESDARQFAARFLQKLYNPHG